MRPAQYTHPLNVLYDARTATSVRELTAERGEGLAEVMRDLVAIGLSVLPVIRRYAITGQQAADVLDDVMRDQTPGTRALIAARRTPTTTEESDTT